jgi:hypothetical protein
MQRGYAEVGDKRSKRVLASFVEFSTNRLHETNSPCRGISFRVTLFLPTPLRQLRTKLPDSARKPISAKRAASGSWRRQFGNRSRLARVATNACFARLLPDVQVYHKA